MGLFVYRVVHGGEGLSYHCEVGVTESPRAHPKLWCDRVLCEGFINNEDECKSVILKLNSKIIL